MKLYFKAMLFCVKIIYLIIRQKPENIRQKITEKIIPAWSKGR